MRVIAGQLRGLSLNTVNNRSTRPTGSKVRESMFNILTPFLNNQMIGVDLFAGSGALGIEAVSRGISKVYLVDKSHAAIKVIKANLQKTHLESQFYVWSLTAQQAINKFIEQRLRFDLLILDPPYIQHINPIIVQYFIEHHLFNNHALILLETDYDLQSQRRADCSVIAAKKYGQTYVEVWQYEGE